MIFAEVSSGLSDFEISVFRNDDKPKVLVGDTSVIVAVPVVSAALKAVVRTVIIFLESAERTVAKAFPA